MELQYHMNHSCKICWYMYPTNKELTNKNACRCHVTNYCKAWCENCKHDCKKINGWCNKFELKQDKNPVVDIEKEKSVLKIQHDNGLISHNEYNVALKDIISGEFIEISPKISDRNIEIKIVYRGELGAVMLKFIEHLIDNLPDEKQLELLNKYCKHCGSKNQRCQCWNDE